MEDDRLLLVFASKYVEGIESLDDPVPPGTKSSRAEPLSALRAHYPTDAHCVQYVPVGPVAGPGTWPRINKLALRSIRDAGGDVHIHTAIVDMDNPGHAPWTPESLETFAVQLLDYEDDPLVAWCSGIYTTKHGARFFYTLEEPMLPEDFEPRHIALVQAIQTLGFPADPGCSDWTRFFRMPNVVRDGRAQHGEWWHRLVLKEGVRFPLHVLQPKQKERKQTQEYAERVRIERAHPEEDDADALLYAHQGGKQVMTPWMRNAKKALGGNKFFEMLFEGEIPEEGERDNTIYEAAASLIGCLVRRDWKGCPETTPEHIWALLLPVLRTLEPDAGTPDWLAKGWHCVKDNWEKEDAKHRAMVEKAAGDESALARIARAVSGWDSKISALVEAGGIDEKSGTITEDSLLGLVNRRLIAALPTGREFYVMQPDGRYSPTPVSSQMLIPYCRAVLDEIIPTYRMAGGRDAKLVDCDPRDLINNFTTIVSEVVFEPNDTPGGFLRNADTPHASIVIPPYGRNPDLEPTYDERVDTWLRLLFGDHYDRAERWLAWALAFEEGPICALSIVGPSGAGKTMLKTALSEVLQRPDGAEFEDLTGDWQYGLLKSPFVFAEEGLSLGYRRIHPADAFRRLVGDHRIIIKRKNLAPASMFNNIRLLFTANNDTFLRSLVEGKDMQPEDREALAVRLMHLDVSSAATEFLRAKGGRRFTNGWIADSGRPSGYAIARHLLHLYEKRESLGRDERLLVEGNIIDTKMDELRLHSGSVNIVLEALITMIRQWRQITGNERYDFAVVRDECAVYVTAATIRDFIKDRMTHIKQDTTIQSVATAMKTIIRDQDSTLKSINGARRRWYRLDLSFLHNAAERFGWPTEQIEYIMYGKEEPHGTTDPIPFKQERA